MFKHDVASAIHIGYEILNGNSLQRIANPKGVRTHSDKVSYPKKGTNPHLLISISPSQTTPPYSR